MLAVLQAPDMQSALARARERCGADAVVVATRRTEHGVEIELEMPGERHDWLAQGGRMVVVGPPGAGKSTLLAALAARWVLRHGARRARLFGLGAAHSLAAHGLQHVGRLVGLPTAAHPTVDELINALPASELHSLQLIEIPTRAIETADLLPLVGVTPCSVLLALPATLHARSAQHALRRHRAARPTAVVLTHCADSAAPYEVVAAASAAGLPIAYRLVGTRIPDDLLNAEHPVKTSLPERTRHAVA